MSFHIWKKHRDREMKTNNWMKLFSLLAMMTVTLMPVRAALAAGVALEGITHTTLPGDQVQITLEMSGPAPQPGAFTIDNPARIAIDLPNTSLDMADRNVEVNAGAARTVRALEANGRTRLVVGLVRMVPYEVRVEDNLIHLTLKPTGSAAAPGAVDAQGYVTTARSRVENVDFRRGVNGEGRVSLTLSNPSSIVDVKEQGGKIIVDLVNVRLDDRLERRLDVTDFATPVVTIDSYNTEAGTRISVTPTGYYEHMAYQTGDTFVLEVKPLSQQEVEKAKEDEFGYSGEKLSLNFQNIEVRAVLQLLADFTGLNIIVSDTVGGTITLRLKNVPWDQALDIILKTRGLGKRQSGNVMLIAPNDELMAREQAELEAQKQMVELAPLRTEYFQINYAKAQDIADLLKSEANTIISARGNVTVDERTNTLMVLETNEKLEEVAALIERLDIAVRQVMIESRVVIATDDYSRSIGARTGFSRLVDNTLPQGATSGTIESTSEMFNAGRGVFPEDRLNVNLAAPGAPSIALGILGKSYLLDMELSALQSEGRGEVISNPRVITSNQSEALIEAGVEIPYQEASSSGATTVSFKKAVLSLTVTPQITPDDRVIMDLQVNKDSVGEVYGGIPTINTQEVKTQVLVNNGDTVVLGGIYEQSRYEGEEKVPLLGDVPVLGMLFRRTTTYDDKSELLVFVTPKILKEGLSSISP